MADEDTATVPAYVVVKIPLVDNPHPEVLGIYPTPSAASRVQNEAIANGKGDIYAHIATVEFDPDDWT